MTDETETSPLDLIQEVVSGINENTAAQQLAYRSVIAVIEQHREDFYKLVDVVKDIVEVVNALAKDPKQQLDIERVMQIAGQQSSDYDD